MILANVVWPALYLSQRYYSWWAIGLSLLIEVAVLYWLTKKSIPKCILMAIVANAFSALVGVFGFVWVGFAWEYFVSYTIYRIFSVGTFNPFGWAATTVIAAFFSCTLEWLVIKYFFRISTTKKFYWIFFLANLITASIALASVFTNPIEL